MSTPFPASLARLRPAPGTDEHELEQSLRDVRAAIEGGQSMDHIDRALGAAPHEVNATSRASGHFRELLSGPFPTRAGEVRPAGERTIVSVRSVPGIDPLAPEWSRGLRPSHTRGPFVSELGQHFWIDSFLLRPAITVEAIEPTGASRLLAQLPSAVTSGDAVRIGPGSVWFPTAWLAVGRPADEFMGMRVRGGSIHLTGATHPDPTRIVLQRDWSAQFELTLDPPADPARATRTGADASHVRVWGPGTVRITLSPGRPARFDFERFGARTFGTAVEFDRAAAQPFVDAVSRSLVVPCDATRPTFTFASVRDRTFQCAGHASIARSGWAVPVTVTSAAALGEAASAGAAWLELAGRMQVEWIGRATPQPVRSIVLLAAPASLTVYATLLGTDAQYALQLWNDAAALEPRRCSLELTTKAGATVLHSSAPGSEGVLIAGSVRARLDRPLQSDGGRLAATFNAGWFVVAATDEATTAGAIASEPAAASAPHISFALENALIKTRPAALLFASGPLAGDRLDSGRVTLRFPLRTFLPTLPDPYVANFELARTDVDTGWATATVTWAEPAAPVLGFLLQGSSPIAPQLASETFSARGVAGRRVPWLALLDVSSNADQFGIVFPTAGEHTAVAGMNIVVPAGEAPVITLPPISWEPMLAKAPESGSGDLVLPPPPHDGGPAAVLAESADLRPATPLSLLSAHYAAMRDNAHFAARLPLPFGLVANVQTRVELPVAEHSTFAARGGSVFMNRPDFPGGLTGARQLGLRSAPRGVEADAPGGFIDATMPGSVEFEGPYTQAMLSTNIHAQLDQEFGPASTRRPGIEPRVPLRHYELTGYGASLFSDWRNTAAPGPAIIQARFDVVVGRTAHEVIQMQSVLYPWFVRVTRSIVIDRTGGGWIFREDTGWVAASDGLFAYDPEAAQAFTPAKRHLGAIVGLERVRNIRLDRPQFALPLTGGPLALSWQGVRFDADVVFRTGTAPRLVVASGSATGRVASHGISGWIQIGGPQTTEIVNGTPVPLTRPANGPEIFNLLQVAGPARAPLHCTVDLGGTDAEPGMVYRVSSVDVECNDNPLQPDLVVALRGSPMLPRDGAWSLARVGAGDPAPRALDPSYPVPLIRPNAGPAAIRWHLGDPADILRLGDADNPVMRYGLVQALGAQKLFFERVRVGDDPAPVSVPQAPKLADMGALLHAAGIFPGLGEAFDLPSLRALAVEHGELKFEEAFDIPAGKEATLVDLAGSVAIRIAIEYHNENGVPTRAKVAVDPQGSPRWRLSLSRVCFAVRYQQQRLISIFATVEADEHTAPTVSDLCVHYEGILDALQVIFSNVQQVARFLPGGKDAGLKVGCSQGRLSVHNAFALPNLPLGAGQITDVAVEMGFDVTLSPFGFRFVAGLGSSQHPFRWVVSPLAGTGCVQVGVGTSGLDVLVQGGLGLGLAIDLGIASGSAAITLAVEISTAETPFAIKGILSGRASVDVLQGLASATITLAAGLGFVPPPELFAPPFLPPQLLPPPAEVPELTVTLLASVAVGIHIRVCWVADVDWDAYWQFRQEIKTPSIPIPV